MQKSVEKYLINFACPEVNIAKGMDHEVFRSFASSCSKFIVVPSYDEGENLDALFESLSTLKDADGLGVILVINEKVSSDASVKARHKLWLQTIQEDGFEFVDFQKSHFLVGSLCEIPTVVVNKTAEHAFESKQGVGLARKIGSDLAVFFYTLAGRDQSFIFHTDADAILPENYFSAWEQSKLPDPKKVSLITHRYQHILPEGASAEQAFAMQAYEHYLYYYADSLRDAGSPYGIQTVGSCLGFSVLAYCQVRGFPKREAGEDFYLVNKLLKVGKAMESPCDPIQLQGRVSYRVPFGTGASIGRISSYGSRSDYKIYNPEVFKVLKKLLRFANDKLEGGEAALDLEFDVRGSVENSGFFVGLDRARTVSSNHEVRLKAFHDWFDGFKTLKLIHLLRDQHYSNIAAEVLLPELRGCSLTGANHHADSEA